MFTTISKHHSKSLTMSSKELQCQFCENYFSHRKVLVHHQKHAKYCLKLRKEPSTIFVCGTCDREYNTKQGLARHHCKFIERKKYDTVFIENNKISRELVEENRKVLVLEGKIEELHDEVDRLTKIIENQQPVVVNQQRYTQKNTININTPDFGSEQFQQAIECGKLTEDYFKDDVITGMANFIKDCCAPDVDDPMPSDYNYVVGDASRKTFKCLELKKWIGDRRGEKLCECVYPHILIPISVYVQKLIDDLKIEGKENMDQFNQQHQEYMNIVRNSDSIPMFKDNGSSYKLEQISEKINYLYKIKNQLPKLENKKNALESELHTSIINKLSQILPHYDQVTN